MSARDDDRVEARIVRPYTVTGGRTRAGHVDLPLVALVGSVGDVPPRGGVPEHGRILELCASQLLSVAELSAHLKLPLGVARVLIGDLVSAGLVQVHHRTQATASTTDQLKVLESVLNGIAQL